MQRGAMVAAVLAATLTTGATVESKGKPPKNRGPRTVQFAGYDWEVKASGRQQVGPGPNYFSDAADSVWVDEFGRLHLRIRRAGKRWYAAEVIGPESLGHGRYRFVLDSATDDFDPSVVLGLFTWSDDPAFEHREIDIEMAKWGQAGDPTNAQYVVQPYTTAGNLLRFAMPRAPVSSHWFAWDPDVIGFGSALGDDPDPAPADVVSEWFYTGPDVPPAGDERPRMNLWLFRGTPPADRQPVEVIIRDFVFEP